MNNKFANASPLDITVPSGGCTSGVGILIGSMFGIAVTTQVQGDNGVVHTEGVFDHLAEGAGSGQAFAFGDPVYWDNTNKRMTKTTSGNTKIGYAAAPKITTATSIRVRLVPFA